MTTFIVGLLLGTVSTLIAFKIFPVLQYFKKPPKVETLETLNVTGRFAFVFKKPLSGADVGAYVAAGTKTVIARNPLHMEIAPGAYTVRLHVTAYFDKHAT